MIAAAWPRGVLDPKFGIAHRVLDVLVPEVMLHRARVLAVVGKLVTELSDQPRSSGHCPRPLRAGSGQKRHQTIENTSGYEMASCYRFYFLPIDFDMNRRPQYPICENFKATDVATEEPTGIAFHSIAPFERGLAERHISTPWRRRS
jgi:hypothetical protein